MAATSTKTLLPVLSTEVAVVMLGALPVLPWVHDYTLTANLNL